MTGTAIPSSSSRGQNQISSATQAATVIPADTIPGADRTISGTSAPKKHRWATRNADSPSTNDGSHQGIANR